MGLNDIYKELDKFKEEPWFVTYGVGIKDNKECIYIYMSGRASEDFYEYIQNVDYEYQIVKTGKIVPL